jgi:hypothetical protein
VFNGNNIFTCTDGGIYKTTDGGTSWTDIENIPNNQFYRVAIHPHESGIYVGGVQDNGTTSGNSSAINNWQRLFGGDGFQPVFDINDPFHYFYEVQNGDIYETLDEGFTFDNISSQLNPNDRRNWDMPYFMSKHNNKVYLGTDKVYVYQSGFIQVLSQDITDGNIYGARFHNISALTESNKVAGKLYAGTSDANVWRSLNNGSSWQNITGNLPERYVSALATSYINPNLVYVTHTGFKSNDFSPHIHKSTDNGTTWLPIHGNLPNFPINDIATYPTNDSILFVATDIGVYATTNSGASWQRLGTNMPYVIVFDIEVDTLKHRLIAGTHGRSMMSYPLDSLIKKTIVSTQTVQSTKNTVRIYPNPSSQTATLQCGTLNPCSVIVYDSKGTTISFTKNIFQSLVLNCNDWSNGVYYIHIRDEKTQEESFLKFLKQ